MICQQKTEVAKNAIATELFLRPTAAKSRPIENIPFVFAATGQFVTLPCPKT